MYNEGSSKSIVKEESNSEVKEENKAEMREMESQKAPIIDINDLM